MAIKIAGTEVINDNKELVLAKLTEINSSIDDTAVDVFIYDTSKDTDGGAWRHRTQHTSWYAEASSASRDEDTRSTRAEFPAVAVIVAESNKVTIYDGDDPSLPMWMVFNADGVGSVMLAANSSNPNTAVTAKNGIIVKSATTYGVATVDFLKDAGDIYWNSSSRRFSSNSVAGRNEVGQSYVTLTDNKLVNNDANDVAMTVLPDAPTDPATGLPVPTIAVATDGCQCH